MMTRDIRLFARHGGFTLIELMVTIVIASILLAVAVPAYQTQIRKSRRTEAKNAVLDLAAREERYLSIYNLYSQAPGDLGYAAPGATTTWSGVGAIGSGYYTLGVVATAPDPTTTPPTLPTYTITATATGLQTKDSACQKFILNQIGQQSSADSGGATTTGSNSICWN
jgi:type IV pilus assembly protein PilE